MIPDPGAVTIVPSGNPPTPHSFVVDWRPPAPPNGIITGYRLRHRQIAIADCDSTEEPWPHYITSQENSHNFTGLQPARTYEVKVTALTSVGYGTSETTSRTTADSGIFILFLLSFQYILVKINLSRLLTGAIMMKNR